MEHEALDNITLLGKLMDEMEQRLAEFSNNLAALNAKLESLEQP